MKAYLFWLPLLYCAHATTQIFTGSLNSTTLVQYLSHNLSTSDKVVSVKFQITNLEYSNTIIYVSFAPLTFNLTPSDISVYLQTNNSALKYMDPLSAIGGIPQRVNALIPANQAVLYITIFNFDDPEVVTNKNYQVQINTFSILYIMCNACPIGSTFLYDSTNPLMCQCSPCQTNYVGATCQYYLNKLSSSTVLEISNTQSKYFLVSSTGSEIRMTVKEQTSSNKVYLYVQYQFNSRMTAGKLNSYYKDQNQSYRYLLSKTQQMIIIPYMGYNVLLTFQSYTSNNSIVSITYNSTRESSSILIIIIAVCVTLVIIIIVLVVFYKVRKNCTATDLNQIQNVIGRSLVDENSLTAKQINKYFPEIVAFTLFRQYKGEMSSNVNIKSEGWNKGWFECSICFDSVKKNDFIRVTYCRHIFHSKCLLQWFHKNPICPNCRQQFDFKTTKQFRSKMKRSTNSNPDRLVKAILGQNYLKEFSENKQRMRIERQFQKQNQIESNIYQAPQSQQSNTFNYL